MARRRRRRSASRRAVKVRVRRRRGTAGIFPRLGGAGKFLPAGALPAAAIGGVGFTLANSLVNRLPAQMQTGWGRILGKAIVAVGLFFAAKRMSPRYAAPLAIGALIPSALDTFNRVRAQVQPGGGVAGYMDGGGTLPMLEGLGEPGGIPQFGNSSALPAFNV